MTAEAEEIRVDHLDFSHAQENPDVWRSDVGPKFFQQELTRVRAATYRKRYPTLPLANGEVIPIRSTMGRGQVAAEVETFNFYGVARWLTTGALSDIPRSDVSRSKLVYKPHEFALSYGWSMKELENAQAANVGLRAEKAFANKRGMMQFDEHVGWYGDDNKGLHGLLNHPNMTVIDAPAGANGAHRWSTIGGTAKTALEMKEDVGLGIRTMRSVTDFIERPTHVYVPPSFWERTSDVVVPNTSKTLRAFLRETYPEITFRENRKLEKAGTYGGPVVLFLHVTGEEDLWFERPISYEEHGPFQNGFDYVVAARQSTAGVVTPFPMAMLRLDFPAD